MKKNKKKIKAKTKTKSKELPYVAVKSKSYGNALKGIKIYYEGPRPRGLKKDGVIGFGKNILECIIREFGPKFRWILTPNTNSVEIKRGITRVRTSLVLLNSMQSEQFERTKDVKNDIIKRKFSEAYSPYFSSPPSAPYVPGTIANILNVGILNMLSGDDRDAIARFLPDFIASESIGSISMLKATAEIETLKELAANLEKEIGIGHSESWWQTYIQKNILIIQQGYIKAIEKINISVGNTKFPDFSLITHDNYLDILEIKKPDTSILKLDKSRGNYHWDTEMSKAVIQVENYISNVEKNADPIRSYLFDNYSMNIKAVRPRGIILAGDLSKFKTQKEKDDFRLLSQGIKNITIVTYDELLIRLKNYINVLEQFCKPIEKIAKIT